MIVRDIVEQQGTAEPSIGMDTRDCLALPCEGIPDVREHIVARDPAMLALMQRIEDVASSNAAVLIIGESGSGKELAAWHLHRRSTRQLGPFVALNCAAVPDAMLERELFGYEACTFLGARSQIAGKLESANCGTLLLDEISEMDLRTQARLLRAIEQREVDPVSHVVSVPLDVRFVATTTKDLHKEVRCGRFRSDLLFRLNVITLKVPPLRERPAGLLALAELFVQKFAVINGRPARTISDDARYTLQRHTWPGNVRELENVLQRAVLTETGPSITPLALDIDASGDDDDRQTEESAHSCGNPAVLPTTGRTIEAVEKDMILDTLCQSRGNRSHTAAVLGISIRTLRNKLHAYERDGTRIPRPVVIGVA